MLKGGVCSLSNLLSICSRKHLCIVSLSKARRFWVGFENERKKELAEKKKNNVHFDSIF